MNLTAPLAIDETLPAELRELLNSPDGPAFEHALDVMVRQREQHLFRALGQLARDLHDAVRRLGGDLAQEGVPGIADMLLAQSWQDLTGQRIKKVASFIGTVESSLLELVRLTGALAGSETPAAVKVSSQEDADRLLSEFGF